MYWGGGGGGGVDEGLRWGVDVNTPSHSGLNTKNTILESTCLLE